MRTSTIAQILGSAILGSSQSVDLGTAATFGALAPAGVTSTGLTLITGDVGGDASVTGFPPGVLTGTIHVGDDVETAAVADSAAAFTSAQLLTPTVDEAGLTTLDGLTLGPGIYKFDLAVTLAGTLTLSGAGDYVFQLASTLTTASLSRVVVTGGASACDVYWIVSTGATLGTSSTFAGNILAGTAITVTTGTSVSGGLYGGTAVTLDTNIIGACDGSSANTTSTASSSSAASSTSIVSSTAITSTAVTTTKTVASSTTTAKTSTTTAKTSTTTAKTSTTTAKTSTTTAKTSTTTAKTSTTTAKTSTTTAKTSTTTAKTSTTTAKTSTTTAKTSTTTAKTTNPATTTAKPSTTLKTSTKKTTTTSSKSTSPTSHPDCPDFLLNPIAFALCILNLHL